MALQRSVLLTIPIQCRENTHMKGQSAPEAKGAAKSKKDLGKKAVLISGPPGIGKTSSAMIICRWAGQGAA